MNIANVKTLIKTMIAHQVPITPMLWGRHGIAKSASVKQVAKEIGYRMLTVILSQKEAVDLAGVLYTFVDPDLGMSVTAAHPPAWFAEAVKRGKLVIFLDEFNMARREVLNAAFQLVLDRELNGLALPADVFVICAGNPEDDRYDVTPLSESLRDRLMHVQVTADVPLWLDWARNEGAIDPSVVEFIQSMPEAAYSPDERDDKFPVEIKHSLRSWERLSQIKALPLPEEIKIECFRGIVGPDWAVAFATKLAGEAPLSAFEIVNFSQGSRAKVTAWTEPNHMRIDLCSGSVSNLITHLKEDKKRNGIANAEALKKFAKVAEFLLMLPADAFGMATAALNQLGEDWSRSILQSEALRDRIVEVRKLELRRRLRDDLPVQTFRGDPDAVALRAAGLRAYAAAVPDTLGSSREDGRRPTARKRLGGTRYSA
jgi:hypothetical protein